MECNKKTKVRNYSPGTKNSKTFNGKSFLKGYNIQRCKSNNKIAKNKKLPKDLLTQGEIEVLLEILQFL